MEIKQYFSLPNKQRPSLYSTEWLQYLESLKEKEIIYLLTIGVKDNKKEWDTVLDIFSDCYTLIPVIKKMQPLVDSNFNETFTEEMFCLLITGAAYNQGYELFEIVTDLWKKNISNNLKCWILESFCVAMEYSCSKEAFDKLKEIADTESDQEICNHANYLIKK